MSAISCSSKALEGALKRVEHAMADDEARPILAGVLLEGDKLGLRVVAADNYRLAIADIADGDFSELGSVCVPRDELGIVRAFLKVWPKDHPIHIERRSSGPMTGQPSLVLSDDYRRVEVRLYDGMYPNYRILLTAKKSDRESIGINPAYLVEASRSVPKGEVVAIRLPATRAKLSAAVQVSGKGYTEIIMPVRLAGSLEPQGATIVAADPA